jgi:Flp pilus assembly protein TadD
MSLLLDALKKSGDSKTPSAADLELEEIQPTPLRKSGTQAEPTISAQTGPINSALPPTSPAKTSTGRAAGENLFAAKKAPPRRRINLGIVPIALIAGGLFGTCYGFYVYLEITPANQRFWSSNTPPQRIAPPVARPTTPPLTGVVATAPTFVPFTQPAPVVAPPIKAQEKPPLKETPRAYKPSPKKPVASRSEVVAHEHAPSLNIQHQPEPDSIDPVLTAAYQAYQNGNYEVANQRYHEAISKDSRNRDALLGLAAIAQQQGQDDMAVNYYRRVLALDPRDAVAQAALASFGSEDNANKESRLKQLISQQPESAALHFALGNQYADQSRWAEAQQAYFNALALEPSNALFAFSLAISLDHIGQRNAAVQYYRQALQFDTSGNSGFNREKAQQRLNQLTSH